MKFSKYLFKILIIFNLNQKIKTYKEYLKDINKNFRILIIKQKKIKAM